MNAETPIEKHGYPFHALVSLFLAFVMVLAITIALGFEHIGGFLSCKLCSEERIPYYIAIPVALIAALFSIYRFPSLLIRLLLLIIGTLMLYNLGLSIYHAGSEYGFWAGPTDCSAGYTTMTANASNLLESLNAVRPPACDKALGYFLGLSFAGWNGVVSFFLLCASLFAAFIRNKF